MTDEPNTANILDHMAYAHDCGSTKFFLLRSGKLECYGCGKVLEGFRWTKEALMGDDETEKVVALQKQILRMGEILQAKDAEIDKLRNELEDERATICVVNYPASQQKDDAENPSYFLWRTDMAGEKFNVAIGVNITREDGVEFFANNLTYSNMSYDDIVGLEKMMVGFLGELTAEGERRAQAKKQK